MMIGYNHVFGACFLVWLVSHHRSVAIQCLECTDVDTPMKCKHIRECAHTETCYTRLSVSTSGRIYWDLGCKLKLECPGQMQVHIIGRSGDPVVCDECCDTVLCQETGCSATKQMDRGPVCYTCENQPFESGCRHVAVCGRDEVCFESLSKSALGVSEFRTGCLESSLCDKSHGHTLASGTMVNGIACFNCCADDLCNYNCTNTALPQATHGPQATQGACVDLQNEAICELTSRYVCVDAVTAHNANCAHYCGFC